MFSAESVGRNISIMRKKRGITQMELANRLGISFQAVSNWERGISMPDIANLKLLAEIFETTTDEILGEVKDVHNVPAVDETEAQPEPEKTGDDAAQPQSETVEHSEGADAKQLLVEMTKRKFASKYEKLAEEYSKLESEYRRMKEEGATEDELDDLEDRMDDLEDALEDIEDDLEDALEDIEDGLEDAFEGIGEGLENAFESFGVGLENAFESIEEGLDDALDALGDKLDGFGDFIENIVDGIGDFIEDVFDSKVFEKLGAKLEKLKESLGRLGGFFN